MLNNINELQAAESTNDLSLNSKKSEGIMRNKVVRIDLMGGLLGLFQSPANKIQQVLNSENNRGWRMKFVLPPNPNILFVALSIMILVFTFGIYMPLPAYIFIMEREEIKKERIKKEQ